MEYVLFLFKVKFLMIALEDNESTKPKVELKVRDGVQDVSAQRMKLHVSLRKLRERISPQVECGNYQYCMSWSNIPERD